MRKYSVSLYLVVVLALFAAWIQTARAAPAREEQVFLKFSQPLLPAIPGKTFTTAVVELAPGARGGAASTRRRVRLCLRPIRPRP